MVPQIRVNFFYNLDIRGFNFGTQYIAERGENHFNGLTVYRDNLSLLFYQRGRVNFYDVVKMYVHFLQFNETMFIQKSFNDFYFFVFDNCGLV